MLLAADVGGTKTLVGLYRAGTPRPIPVETKVYATLDFGGLEEIFEAFLAEVGRPKIDAVAAGVAGPVNGLTAILTNVPDWTADLQAISAKLGGARAALLNDLEAMAYSVSVLQADEVLVLQEGTPATGGTRALIAAGTGMNEAHLHYIDGRVIPSAAEAGHADFSARTPRELAFVADLSATRGRVEVEAVISGPGVVNLFRFTHKDTAPGAECPVQRMNLEEEEIAAEVSTAALAGTCPRCVEALDMFVSAYGAESGNLALRSMATGGVYIGGGIAPKILPAMQNGLFMKAFVAKPPMDDILGRIPVKIILNPSAALIGASVKAAQL